MEGAMSKATRQSRCSIITPAVSDAASVFVDATERALASRNLSPVEARQRINALLGELWDATEPITAQLSASSSNMDSPVDPLVLE